MPESLGRPSGQDTYFSGDPVQSLSCVIHSTNLHSHSQTVHPLVPFVESVSRIVSGLHDTP